MSKAFKCDVCESFYEGNAIMQVKANVIGIKYSPENADAPLYLHDLCDDCHVVFVTKYKEIREIQRRKRKDSDVAK